MRSAYHYFAPTADDAFYQPRSGMVCHPERSEGSRSMGKEMLRSAQHDSTDFGRETSLSALAGCSAILIAKVKSIII
jgi:hypothetical protein